MMPQYSLFEHPCSEGWQQAYSSGPAGGYWGLVGIDGAGKSSVLEALASTELCSTHWRDLVSVFAESNVGPRLNRVSPEYLGSLPPVTRFWYLGLLASAEYEYLVRPKIARGAVVLADSLILKVLTREDFTESQVAQLVDSVPLPTCAIMIDTPPSVARSRKGVSIGRYEAPGGPDSFVAYQERVRDRIFALEAYIDLRVVSGDGRSVSEVAGDVLKEVGRGA